MTRGFPVLLVVGLVLGACTPEAVEERALSRSSRYGILADLVLHPRPARLGGPFFLDRFETTRADWERYLTETERSQFAFQDFDEWNESPDPTLPVVGIDSEAARRYAVWRFGRLPRQAEWEWAASAGGVYRLPWGDSDRTAWANTHELGFGQLTPVGAFESGRSPIGCYDLIGNAAEWCATPWADWLAPEVRVSDAAAWFARAPDAIWRLHALEDDPALTPWRWPGSPFSVAWLWAVDRRSCPLVVIAGYTHSLAGVMRTESRIRARPDQLERRWPAERSSEIGVRVASDPVTLLRRLAAVTAPPTSPERRALERFLARPAVREVLQEAVANDPGTIAGDAPVARLLREALPR